MFSRFESSKSSTREVDHKVAELRAQCQSEDLTESFFIDVLAQAKGDVNQASKMLDTTKEDHFSDLLSMNEKEENPDVERNEFLAQQIREQHDILAKFEEERRKEELQREEQIRHDAEEKRCLEEEKARREQEERIRLEEEEKARREHEEMLRKEQEDKLRLEKEENNRQARDDAAQQEDKASLLEFHIVGENVLNEENAEVEENRVKEEEKEEAHVPKAARPPKVCVYKHSDTLISNSDMDKLFALCSSKDVSKEEVGVIDVTNNLDAHSRLVEMCGHFEYPMIFISDNPVGNFEQAMKLSAEDGNFEALLQGKVDVSLSPRSGSDPSVELLKSVVINPNPQLQEIESLTPEETEEQLRLGVVGGMLGVTEVVLSGVSSLVTLPIAILTWPFRSSPVEETMEEGDEEFLVIQSNWYARSQWRTYRFKKEEFLRLHPNGHVRARHSYSALKSIEYTDRKNIILHYTGDGAPDYLQATAQNIQKMVKRWTAMNEDVVIEGNCLKE